MVKGLLIRALGSAGVGRAHRRLGSLLQSVLEFVPLAGALHLPLDLHGPEAALS